MSHKVTRSQSHKEDWFKFKTALIVSWCLCVLVTFGLSFAYALNLDKAKIYFLDGDFKSSISEGEKILAGGVAGQSQDLDELYYILGLGYMKEGNFLRASDIFEIILTEFKNSALRHDALLGLGDTYFLRGNYEKAQGYYNKIISDNAHTKLKPPVYYRLSQCAAKLGDTHLAEEYLDKLKRDFALSLEAKLDKETHPLSDFYYTVQVGSFSKKTNATNLMQKLTQKGYPAYIQEASSQGKTIYRVRVGQVRFREEAQELESRLTQEGYPTKIFP